MKVVKIYLPFIFSLGIFPLVALAQGEETTVTFNFSKESVIQGYKVEAFNKTVHFTVPPRLTENNHSLLIKRLPDNNFSLVAEKILRSEIFSWQFAADTLQQNYQVTIKAKDKLAKSARLYFWQDTWQVTDATRLDNSFILTSNLSNLTVAIFQDSKSITTLNFPSRQRWQKAEYGPLRLWLSSRDFSQPLTVVLEQLASSTAKLLTPVFAYQLLPQQSKVILQDKLYFYFDYEDETNAAKIGKRWNEETQTWQEGENQNMASVKKVEIVTDKLEGKVAVFREETLKEGIASWYRLFGCYCAASRDYPKGTKLKITNLANDKAVTVKINDYGPEEWTGRLIDLDLAAFKKIASARQGLITVRIEKTP